MESKGFQRILSRTLTVKVVGYSRLMLEGDATIVNTFTRYNQIISDLLKQFCGLPLKRRILCRSA